MNQTIRKIQSILSSAYNTVGFTDFIREIFPSVKIIAPDSFRKEYTNFSSHIEGSAHVGNYTDPDGKNMIIHSVRLKKESYVENSRSTQRSYAKKLIEAGNADAAIIAFYTKGDPKWRISFVRLDYEIKFENGKLNTKENITPAKRYSYLVGEDEPCHTAVSRFRRFLTDDPNMVQPSLDDLEEVFSVEAVTNEFFDKYKEKFCQVVDALNNNDDFMEEASRCGFSTEQFAKKLLGQIVFIYFLQKKGWLGVGVWPESITGREYKDIYYTKTVSSKQKQLIQQYLPYVYIQKSENEYSFGGRSALEKIPDDVEELIANSIPNKKMWGSGPRRYFLWKWFNFAKKRGGNFYDKYLEPLFYDTLNSNRGELGYSSVLHCRIPFMSGGLFEPIKGYDWKNCNFNIPDELFSNRKSENDPDADGILDIFDRYNFTMSEDEPLEREVAIDPEMLGKVFENLLDVKDRKSKGAFYTPREIVHFMCQESLINYLSTNMDISESAIRDFILYGDFYKDSDTEKTKRVTEESGKIHFEFDPEKRLRISPEIFNMKKGINRIYEIDNLLKNIRVADPAVGSGAFLLGMLNEIVRARQNCSAYMATSMNAYNSRLMYINERSPHTMKQEAIRDCIFAADIEPSAVDIAQLRLWLALVIDDEINPDACSPLDGHRNPLPLPNLESNIICGNTLVDEFEGYPLIPQSSVINTNAGKEYSWNQAAIEALIPKLVDAQNRLFVCDEPFKKEQLKAEIEAIKDQMIREQLSVFPDEISRKYDESKLLASKPYILWQIEFARVFKEKGGFDVVIGNPPYIGFHKVPNKDYNKMHYLTADGKYDFYVLFIERALQLASSKGFVSFICPSYFYKRNYGKKTRNLLLRNTAIKFIADFADYQIFDSALTYTCIFGASKIAIPDNNIRIQNKSLDISSSYIIKQNTLTEPTWILEKPESNAILDKIQAASSYVFGDITVSISQGIVTGNNDVFLINESVIKDLNLEERYLHKAYKGKDVGNGKLLDGNYKIFYPYVINEKGKTVCISEDELRLNAPNMYSYLLQKKELLLSRGYFVKSNKQWFEL